MARTTKQLSGGGKDKFLRALIAGEKGIPAAAADRLGNAMCASIADLRARRDAWEPSKQPTPSAPVSIPNASHAAALPDALSTAHGETLFDPFAFSALAVLTKHGAQSLAQRLATIDRADNLRALANAQHLGIGAEITDAAALRTAIVAATEARLAERRAAAS